MDKIGKYTVLGELGRGGMGEVYKAHDPNIDRIVAIKIVSANFTGDEDLRKRFVREAKSAGRLAHENITVVHDVGEFQGRTFIVMEYLEGTDLKTMIRHHVPMDLTQKLDMAIQICKGLEYAHTHGIIHRDIKPENIRLLDNRRVKIMDFGIAKPESSSLTKRGVILGTPAYISPEQVNSDKIDRRTDIFSFGVVFYELLTYRRLFTGSVPTILFRIVHEEPEPLVIDDFPQLESLRKVVNKCLKKDPADRYSACRLIVDDLEALWAEMKGVTLPMRRASTPDTGITLENLLKEGKTYFKKGSYEKAEGIFKIILAQVPSHQAAQDFLAKIHKARTSPTAPIETEEGQTFVLLPEKTDHRKFWILGGALAVLAIIVLAWFGFVPKSKREIPLTVSDHSAGEVVETTIPEESLFKEEAAAAQLEAERLKSQASEATADRYAPEFFQSGVQKEQTARQAMDAGQYEQALTNFQAAQRDFQSAREEAETQQALNDLAALKTRVTQTRDGVRKARQAAEQAGALASARDVFDSGVRLEEKADRAFAGGSKGTLLEAQRNYSAARQKFDEAKSQSQRTATARTRALEARNALETAKNGLFLDGDNPYHPKIEAAEQLATQAKSLFQEGRYANARRTYLQAEALYREIREDLVLEAREKARTARREMLTAKSRADSQTSGFARAQAREQQGETGFEQGDFLLAAEHFLGAKELFEKAVPSPETQPVPVVPTEASPSEAKEPDLQPLIDTYRKHLERGDASGLAVLLGLSNSEQRGWQAFFENTQRVKAHIQVAQSELQTDGGAVLLKVKLSYYNKSNHSEETRDFNARWELSKAADSWKIISHQ